MKKIINAIRDFIYNITDYGLIIAVVVIMIGVLFWRFDILFSRNIDKDVIALNPETESSETEIPKKTDTNAENPGNIAEKPVDSTNEAVNNLVATIEIPQGSFPTKIGDILVNSNIIKDKNAFLNRSVEMGLDTKLQSGTFQISLGTSLDDVIKTIAKSH